MEEADDGTNVLAAEEYNVQYFGFSPQSFMNGMYNAILEYLHEGITALNDTVLNTFAGRVSEMELKEITGKQGQAAVRRLDQHFDKAELYLGKNVFSVPPHVVLPEDRLQVDKPYSEDQMAELDTQIQAVTDRIMAVKYANAQILERMSQLEELQPQFDASLKQVQTTHSEVSSQARSFLNTVNSLAHLNGLIDSVNLDSDTT